jgi:hypothetical protein
MNKAEKTIVIGTFGLTVLFIVLFNLNMPHYWGNSPLVVPESAIDTLWLICMLLSITTLFLCIRDSGKRDLTNRIGWVAYMLLIGAIGIPHYYIKHGRFPCV